jgi:transcriptional regulator with XRE-family HTH domain
MKEGRETVLGYNLQLLLGFIGISQREVAERIEVDKNTITWWKKGRSFPPRNHRNELVELFKELIPGLQIDADSIAVVRLTEQDLLKPTRAKIGDEESPRDMGVSGLAELELDRSMVDLLSITEREWETLRGIVWPEWYIPGKKVFIEILHDFRKSQGRSK